MYAHSVNADDDNPQSCRRVSEEMVVVLDCSGGETDGEGREDQKQSGKLKKDTRNATFFVMMKKCHVA